MKKIICAALLLSLLACEKENIKNETDPPAGARTIKFDKDTIHVSKAGGTYTVKIEANTQFKQAAYSPQQAASSMPDIRTKINLLEKKFSANEMTIRVGPSSGTVMRDSTIIITTPDGEDSASVVINQEGDPETAPFDEQLKNFGIYTMAMAAQAFDLFYTVEALYTKTANLNASWAMQFYQKTVTAESPTIMDMWARPYKAIRGTNLIILQPGVPESLKASYKVLRSILYYQMAVLWKRVPYLTEPYEVNPVLKQTEYDELLRQLYDTFNESAPLLKNEKIDTGWVVSSDIAIQMQAKVLINQKKYSEASLLLDNIIGSNKYALVADRNTALKKSNTELIQGVLLPDNNPVTPYTIFYKQLYNNAEIFPVARFTETILLAAECNIKLGNNAKVVSLLNSINAARGQAPGYSPATNVTIDDLQTLWQKELYGEFSYFDFLKRNGLAEEVLNIPAYQTLLPFPLQELTLNPYLVQNEGY